MIAGVRQAIPLFCLDLPHSDGGFVKAYLAERTEAFLDGHVAAFSFLAEEQQIYWQNRGSEPPAGQQPKPATPGDTVHRDA